MNWYIPGYKQMKENRGERTYNYQSEITDTTFLDAVDNGIIPVDLYTECYRSQMSDVYETYNLKENNSPIELRNALPGELSHHKRSLFYRDEFEQFYTDSDLTKMKNHISYFENNNVNPIDSYYGVTNLNESRYGGMQAFEDETLFLDNSSKNADAKDPDYRRLYKKYQFDLPKFYDVHNKLILQRAKLYNAYNPKEAGLTVGKSINFDFFTFLYDLNNPMDMLKEEEVLPTYILTDKQKNEMTQNELDDFGFSVKIVDYKGLMQFVTDECLIEEMDNHTKKIVDGKTIKNWDTETEYFKHLRDNKNWTLRRKFYRGHFLASLPMLMTKKIVVVKDTTRVVTDKTFRDILRQQGGKDSRGNVVESMLKLKKKYAKSHTYPHSWGVDENGLTIGKFTSIFTQEENRKIGAQVHV